MVRLDYASPTRKQGLTPKSPPHPVPASPYRVLSIVIVGILLTAAGLKGYELATNATKAMLETSFFTSRWFLIVLVDFEASMACCLLLSVFRLFNPRQIRAVAFATFGAFACVSIHKGVTGERSCACFGMVEVSPWIALTIDIGVMILLICVSPDPPGSHDAPSFLRPWLLFLLIMVVGFLALLALTGYHSSLTGDSQQVARVDFGRVLPGASIENVIEVVNTGAASVEIERIESSCKCLHVVFAGRTFAPAQKQRVRLILDLSSEPTFEGRLRIYAEALTKAGDVVFFIDATADVKR